MNNYKIFFIGPNAYVAYISQQLRMNLLHERRASFIRDRQDAHSLAGYSGVGNYWVNVEQSAPPEIVAHMSARHFTEINLARAAQLLSAPVVTRSDIAAKNVAESDYVAAMNALRKAVLAVQALEAKTHDVDIQRAVATLENVEQRLAAWRLGQ